ncbi:MAG: hypothetical protein ACOYKA_00660 [Legionellaceae bacterium]
MPLTRELEHVISTITNADRYYPQQLIEGSDSEDDEQGKMMSLARGQALEAIATHQDIFKLNNSTDVSEFIVTTLRHNSKQEDATWCVISLLKKMPMGHLLHIAPSLIALLCGEEEQNFVKNDVLYACIALIKTPEDLIKIFENLYSMVNISSATEEENTFIGNIQHLLPVIMTHLLTLPQNTRAFVSLLTHLMANSALCKQELYPTLLECFYLLISHHDRREGISFFKEQLLQDKPILTVKKYYSGILLQSNAEERLTEFYSILTILREQTIKNPDVLSFFVLTLEYLCLSLDLEQIGTASQLLRDTHEVAPHVLTIEQLNRCIHLMDRKRNVVQSIQVIQPDDAQESEEQLDDQTLIQLEAFVNMPSEDEHEDIHEDEHEDEYEDEHEDEYEDEDEDEYEDEDEDEDDLEQLAYTYFKTANDQKAQMIVNTILAKIPVTCVSQVSPVWNTFSRHTDDQMIMPVLIAMAQHFKNSRWAVMAGGFDCVNFINIMIEPNLDPIYSEKLFELLRLMISPNYFYEVLPALMNALMIIKRQPHPEHERVKINIDRVIQLLLSLFKWADPHQKIEFWASLREFLHDNSSMHLRAFLASALAKYSAELIMRAAPDEFNAQIIQLKQVLALCLVGEPDGMDHTGSIDTLILRHLDYQNALIAVVPYIEDLGLENKFKSQLASSISSKVTRTPCTASVMAALFLRLPVGASNPVIMRLFNQLHQLNEYHDEVHHHRLLNQALILATYALIAYQPTSRDDPVAKYQFDVVLTHLFLLITNKNAKIQGCGIVTLDALTRRLGAPLLITRMPKGRLEGDAALKIIDFSHGLWSKPLDSTNLTNQYFVCNQLYLRLLKKLKDWLAHAVKPAEDPQVSSVNRVIERIEKDWNLIKDNHKRTREEVDTEEDPCHKKMRP